MAMGRLNGRKIDMWSTRKWQSLGIAAAILIGSVSFSGADDLMQVRERGVLRHLSIPYANFNTGSGSGLDVDLMKLFAADLGVEYRYAPSTWSDVIGDLTGTMVKPDGNDVKELGATPIRGDVVANGFTILQWRQSVVAYSTPTFPTQVWLVTPASSSLRPIIPSGDEEKDIAATRALLDGLTVLGKPGTCLDPALYDIAATGAREKGFTGGLNDLAPALLVGKADVLLLDVPDCLVALRKWPGELKVIGPMSTRQQMAPAFRKDAPRLREAFNSFLVQCKEDGTLLELVHKYYPDVFIYYPEFYADCRSGNNE